MKVILSTNQSNFYENWGSERQCQYDGYKCGSRPLQQYVFLSSIDVFMYIYIYIYFYELVNTLVRCDPNYDVCV